ncbi:MAG TPA: hypothetical protein VMB52_01655 [Verrucomicrobiae bacterium]|nr:hypothetical protein [Verrucomicrobiae bacterium]
MGATVFLDGGLLGPLTPVRDLPTTRESFTGAAGLGAAPLGIANSAPYSIMMQIRRLTMLASLLVEIDERVGIERLLYVGL